MGWTSLMKKTIGLLILFYIPTLAAQGKLGLSNVIDMFSSGGIVYACLNMYLLYVAVKTWILFWAEFDIEGMGKKIWVPSMYTILYQSWPDLVNLLDSSWILK